MMKKYILVSTLLLATASITSVYAQQNMGDMKMMGDKFNMQMEKAEDMAMKMQKENNSSKKKQYMNNHMQSMKDMMGMMEKMRGMMPNPDGKGMMMDNKGTMSKIQSDGKGDSQGMGMGKGQGGMMMGGMSDRSA